MKNNMTLNEFIDTYYGKSTQYNFKDTNQSVYCTDLAKMYCDYCLGINSGYGETNKPWNCGNAMQWYKQFSSHDALKEKMFRITYKHDFIPIRGDLCIWALNNKHGHIAIASGNGNNKYFYTYDQDWNGKKEMEKVKHDYGTFLGVIRPLRYVTKDVEVHCKPTASSKVVAKIEKSTIIKVLEISRNGKWARIDKDCWVSLKYINEI